MTAEQVNALAEALLETALEGGSSPAIRNKVYDRVISGLEELAPLAAVLVAMKLSEYIAPYDPYKFRELQARMLEHLVNPDVSPGKEEPPREHSSPPGPGPDVVAAAHRAKRLAREKGQKKRPKPQPKVQPQTPAKSALPQENPQPPASPPPGVVRKAAVTDRASLSLVPSNSDSQE